MQKDQEGVTKTSPKWPVRNAPDILQDLSTKLGIPASCLKTLGQNLASSGVSLGDDNLSKNIPCTQNLVSSFHP